MIAQLKELVPTLLAEARLSHGEVTVAATPRRLSVVVEQVAPRQPDAIRSVRGPTREAATKNPQALLGFCRKNGITPEQVVYEIENDVEYAVAKSEHQGRRQ